MRLHGEAMMQRAGVAAVLALVVLAWPVEAQLFPTPTGSDQPATPAEQTLLDATIVMHPPDIDSLCMRIGAGRLTVTTRLVDPADGQQRRTDFALNGYMADPNVNVTVVVTPNETTTIVPLAGAMYCWRLGVAVGSLPANAAQMSLAERGAFIQSVALRMTLVPQ